MRTQTSLRNSKKYRQSWMVFAASFIAISQVTSPSPALANIVPAKCGDGRAEAVTNKRIGISLVSPDRGDVAGLYITDFVGKRVSEYASIPLSLFEDGYDQQNESLNVEIWCRPGDGSKNRYPDDKHFLGNVGSRNGDAIPATNGNIKVPASIILDGTGIEPNDIIERFVITLENFPARRNPASVFLSRFGSKIGALQLDLKKVGTCDDLSSPQSAARKRNRIFDRIRSNDRFNRPLD